MANFEQALERTLRFEGGYSNNPNDAGGETFCGISRRYWPKWEGWETLDEIHKLPSGTVNIALDNQLRKDVARLYYTEFWEKIHGDEIESQEIANYLFDFAVNSDPRDAVKCFQSAWNKHSTNFQLKVDGKLGSKTLAILRSSTINIKDKMVIYRLHHILVNIGNGKIHPSFAKGLAERAIA